MGAGIDFETSWQKPWEIFYPKEDQKQEKKNKNLSQNILPFTSGLTTLPQSLSNWSLGS